MCFVKHVDMFSLQSWLIGTLMMMEGEKVLIDLQSVFLYPDKHDSNPFGWLYNVLIGMTCNLWPSFYFLLYAV